MLLKVIYQSASDAVPNAETLQRVITRPQLNCCEADFQV